MDRYTPGGIPTRRVTGVELLDASATVESPGVTTGREGKDTAVRVTVPEKPRMLVMVTVTFADDPSKMLSDAGLGARLKSGTTTRTVTVTE